MNNEINAIRPTILVYQDEDCSTLIDYLSFYNFNVIASSENDVFEKLRKDNYDICILGHLKSDIPDDLKMLKYARKVKPKVPIIFISSVDDYPHIIDAFNAGTDDYIIRPYNLEELICRVNALLKRCRAQIRILDAIYEIGKCIFNAETGVLTLSSNNTEIKLVGKAKRVLSFLCAYKGNVIPRAILLNSIWGVDDPFVKRSLDVYICRLRNIFKYENIKIEYSRKEGYSLVVNKK